MGFATTGRIITTIKELAVDPLGQLESVNLHDIDISEVVLRSIEEVWASIRVPRPPEWKRKAASSPSGVTADFGKLLLAKLGSVQDDIKREQARIAEAKRREEERIKEDKRREEERIAREKARVLEETVAATVDELLPLSEFLKHALWKYVATQRKVLVDPMVLRVFRLPTESEEDVMPIKYGIDRNSQVLHRSSGSKAAAYYWWKLDARGFKSNSKTPGEGSNDMDYDFEKVWTRYVQESTHRRSSFRARLMPLLAHCLLTASDDYGLYVPLETREEAATRSTVDALANQVSSFHSLMEAARVKAAATVGEATGLSVLSQALSRSLGLKAMISMCNVWLCTKETTFGHNLNDWWSVDFHEGGTPFATYKSTTSDSTTTVIWTPLVFTITLHMPVE